MDTLAYDQPSAAPTTKVAAATTAGALMVVIGWLTETLLGVEIPLAVAQAITALIMVVAAYVVPNRGRVRRPAVAHDPMGVSEHGPLPRQSGEDEDERPN